MRGRQSVNVTWPLNHNFSKCCEHRVEKSWLSLWSVGAHSWGGGSGAENLLYFAMWSGLCGIGWRGIMSKRSSRGRAQWSVTIVEGCLQECHGNMEEDLELTRGSWIRSNRHTHGHESPKAVTATCPKGPFSFSSFSPSSAAAVSLSLPLLE